MTIQEILKSQGMTDEQVEKVMGEMKQNKIFTSSQENVDIRFDKLKADAAGKTAELEKANGLIAELQKSAKGNEAMQSKITAYEAEVAKLREELEKTKVDAAIKVGLLSEHAEDVDYLTFKLREKGDLTLDDNGDIKGWADKVAALKTQFPNQFSDTGDSRKVEPQRLPDPEEQHGNGLTRSEVLKKPYAERLKMFEENPEGFRELMQQKG